MQWSSGTRTIRDNAYDVSQWDVRKRAVDARAEPTAWRGAGTCPFLQLPGNTKPQRLAPAQPALQKAGTGAGIGSRPRILFCADHYNYQGIGDNMKILVIAAIINYSTVTNIGYRWSAEERPYELWVALNRVQIGVDA